MMDLIRPALLQQRPQFGIQVQGGEFADLIRVVVIDERLYGVDGGVDSATSEQGRHGAGEESGAPPDGQQAASIFSG